MANSAGEMAVFARVVERGSFAAAADDLGLSPSAVSKLITRLESRLGARLLIRTTRRLVVTAEGELFVDRSRKILDAIEAAEAEIASGRRGPQGHLRVHVFPTFAVDHLSAALPNFLDRYPRITFEFLVTNRDVDLIDDNIDVALQVGPLGKSALAARKITDLTQIVCASPTYLARHGRPAHPSDLERHECLTLSHIPGSRIWQFADSDKAVRVEVGGRAAADSAHMLLKLAIAGAGIIRFGDIIVGKAIHDGLLVRLLEDWQEAGRFPLWALHQTGRQRVPRVKAFIDFLIERFGKSPWLSMPDN